ncbi:enoyl-CoA hydratase-related protein [Microbacterium terregens]|uniref:Enoyl-CoA hydratase-related protein n=1 Tax=Microbacterium terregens TaxID=69363 RepID=A0ABV5SV00_9MICO
MVITINRPEVRNCVNAAVQLGIGGALDEAEGDRDIRTVVLTGAGEAFCAAADLKAVSRGESLLPEDPVARSWGFAGYAFHPITKPTIAAVNGAALGGGTELVLASDLAVSASTARFGLPEVTHGLFASEGGVMRLARQIPPKRAMEIMLTEDPIDAREAFVLGLVNRVVAPGDVLDAALEFAERINANAPLAVVASKRVAKGSSEDDRSMKSTDSPSRTNFSSWYGHRETFGRGRVRLLSIARPGGRAAKRNDRLCAPYPRAEGPSRIANDSDRRDSSQPSRPEIPRLTATMIVRGPAATVHRRRGVRRVEHALHSLHVRVGTVMSIRSSEGRRY